MYQKVNKLQPTRMFPRVIHGLVAPVDCQFLLKGYWKRGRGSVKTTITLYLSCFILLGVIKDQERNPEPLDVFKSQRVLRARVFQVQIFDSVVVPIVASSLTGQVQDDYHSRTRRNFKMYTWSTSSILMMSITDIETLMLTGMFLLLILSKLKGAIFLL